jgi:hypothetical protein
MLTLNFLLFFLIRGFYVKDYDEVDLDYSAYLLADSHGIPLGDFTELYDVHNFSGHSDSYLDMERKLNYLIRNTNVSKVYISVDDHMLSPTRERQNNLDRSAYYTENEDFSHFKDFFLEKYLKYYCVFLNDRYSLVIKNFLQDELFDYSKWGGTSSKSKWEELTTTEQVAMSRDRVENYFDSTYASAKLSDSLQRIIYLCKTKNIELIGLRFPLSKTYVDILENESYEADSVFEGNQLEIVDFDSLFLEKDYMFRDMDHMDKAGGEEFVDILFDSLDKKIVY